MWKMFICFAFMCTTQMYTLIGVCAYTFHLNTLPHTPHHRKRLLFCFFGFLSALTLTLTPKTACVYEQQQLTLDNTNQFLFFPFMNFSL